MSKRLSMRKIREILRLHFDLKRSNREIGHSIRISNSTVSKCLKRAREVGLKWPLPDNLSDDQLEQLLYRRLDNPLTSEPKGMDFSYLHTELKRKGVTLQLLWHEYKEQHLKGFSYSRFCDLYKNWKKTIDVSMRQEHKLAEKLFIDYSGMTVPIVVNSKTGDIRKAEIFVAILGASNYTFVEATWSQGLPDWIGSHVHAFNFFGGVPDILVPDNLKSGVTKYHRYEPDINPTYRDLAEHYQVAVIPARVRAPKDKAKAEQAVLHVERTILSKLRNRVFYSLEEVNEAIKPLLEQLNRQPFQKLPGSRLSQFENLEKPLLRPLPSNRYEFAQWKKTTLGSDYHIFLDDHYYSVPYKYITKKLDIRYTTQIVEIFYKSKRIASHRRSNEKGKCTTVKEHRPKKHQKYAEWTSESIIAWSKKQGSFVQLMVQKIMEKYPHPAQGIRSCLGLIKLEKSYGHRLENACQRALAINATSYKEIESILKNNLDQCSLPEEKEAHPITEVIHDNVRGRNYFN